MTDSKRHSMIADIWLMLACLFTIGGHWAQVGICIVMCATRTYRWAEALRYERDPARIVEEAVKRANVAGG